MATRRKKNTIHISMLLWFVKIRTIALHRADFLASYGLHDTSPQTNSDVRHKFENGQAMFKA